MTTPLDTQPATEPPADGRAAPAPRRRRWRTVALIVGAPLLVVALAFAALQLFKPHIYAGTIMQAPTAAPSMDGLVWSDGSPVELAEFGGDVVVVFFGYTYCPDICPTTMSQVNKALDRMDGDTDRVHVMMVSVDPERDRPADVGRYVEAFDPSFRGATGEPADVERIASTYGVFFARGEEFANGDYAVDHSAYLMGIDTEGHLRIVWPSTVEIDDLAADLDALL